MGEDKSGIYVGGHCFQCGGHNIGFAKPEAEGIKVVCADCGAWEWLDDAVDTNFVKKVEK